MRYTLIFLPLCGLWLTQGILPALAVARHCGGDQPCQCGDVVDKNYTLPADLGPCPARGLAVVSGITLDCAGRAIRGSGEQPSEFGIVLSRGVSNATVKNCEVSGFLRGIRLQGANKNRILHNVTHHNGNFTTHVGYGIDVAGAQENLFQGNHIHHNADEGIHIGTSSHGNQLIDNRVEDNERENVYFLRADRGILRNNVTRGGGANSVFIKHSSFLRLENNTFHDRPVMLRGDAHDNVLVDNEFVETGIVVQAYEEQGTIFRPTRNEFVGGVIANAKECIKFANTSGNIIRNVTLKNCNRSVVAKAENGNVENTFVNVTLPPETIALDATSVVHVRRRFDLIVQDDKGAPVAGARVQGVDARKNSVFDALTGSDGKIPAQELLLYSLTGSTKTSYTPYRLQVSSGQKTVTRDLDASEDAAITITLP
jgi:parallel beta-helix repeat protein